MSNNLLLFARRKAEEKIEMGSKKERFYFLLVSRRRLERRTLALKGRCSTN